jgi:outer membrane protein TolC
MKLKTISLIIFLLVIFIPFAYSQEKDQLETLLEEALKNNPEIQVAYHNWKAAEYKTIQVKSLPDPTARYTYFGESIETRVGPQERKLGASQKIPFPAKLSIKGKAHLKHAQMLQRQYEAKKRETIKNVKFIFYDIFWTDKAIQITEEENIILESLEKVAQRKYEVNRAPQQDVVKVQVELSRLIDKLFLFRQKRKSLVSKLNSIINRDQDSELEKISNISLNDSPYSCDELKEQALSFNPELSAADLNIQRAGYEKSLAQLDYVPDLTFSIDYITVGSGYTTHPEDGKDSWIVTAAINIPLWFQRLSAQMKEKEALLESALKAQENIKNTIEYEVDDMCLKISTYEDIISLYKTALIPQTEQSFEVARIGYESGKVDILNWLDAERVLLQTRLAYYKAMVDYQKSIAYLERIVGKDL